MSVVYTFPFNGTLGNWGPDWALSASPAGGVTDLLSDKGRMQTSTTAGQAQRAILNAARWNKTNGKGTAWFTTSNPVGSIVPQIMLRGSGDWSSEIDTPTTGYKLIWVVGLGLGLFKRTGGVTSQIGGWVAKTLNASTTYGMTLQTVGTGTVTLYGRLWTGVEPGTWDIDGAVDNTSPINGPGQFQMALLTQDPAALTVLWDDVSLDDLQTAATGPRPRLVRV
jgi:hypothetical protein